MIAGSIASPSFNPKRLLRLPATIFRITTSTGTIVTFFVSISRSLNRSIKCVGIPSCSRSRKSRSEILLLMMPFSTMVPRFCALKAVASSLKYCTTWSGRAVAKIFLALPSYNIAPMPPMIASLMIRLLRQGLDQLIHRLRRADKNRIPETPVVSCFLHLLQGEDQTLKVVQLGGFKIGNKVEIIQAGRVVEFPLDRLVIRQGGLRVLLHHARPFILRQRPPIGVFPDGNDDGIGPRLARRLHVVFHLVGKSGHVVRLLSQPMKDGDAGEIFTERAVLEIDEKLLTVFQFH